MRSVTNRLGAIVGRELAVLLLPPSPKDDWYNDGCGMSGWVLESSEEVVPHCPTTPPPLPPPPDPHVVPAIKEDDDSVRFVYRRDEGVDGPVETSNDIALTNKECVIYMSDIISKANEM